MTPLQIEAFFTRIGMDTPEHPTVNALHEIQRRHIASVPFENLDIIDGNTPLRLDTDALFEKIVERKHGGICYELNLLLADTLNAIGYQVTLLSGAHPKYGDAFDHAFMLAKACDSNASWIVDVGFADNFCTPLPFPANGRSEWLSDERDEYQFRPCDTPDTYELVRRRNGNELLMFTFTTTPRRREEYQSRCDWYATSAQSRFTQGPLICIERPEGRISLTMNRVLNTYKGERIRIDINSQEEFKYALKEIFGIDIG